MRVVSVRRGATVGLGAALACLMVFAGSAAGATTTYPAGGSGFATDTEGWSPGTMSCTPAALLCTPEDAYESGVGNPPGSIAAKTTVTLNLLNLFKGTEVWESPQFTIPVGSVTGARLRLDRAFDAGGLVSVTPTATYTVTLRDLTAGTSTTPLTEELGEEDSTFATHSAPASIVGGHTYQLSIESVTAQGGLSLAPLGGTSAVRFDNIGLEVQTAGEGSGGGGTGGSAAGGGTAGTGGAGSVSSGLTRVQLKKLIRSSLAGSATLHRNRLTVRAKCPARLERACRIVVQGLLHKHRAATTRRRARVAKARRRRFFLAVRRAARRKVAKRTRILVKETVHAGTAHVTVYRRLKLVHR